MAPPDRLERVTDLLLVLLDTTRPLSLREIVDRVPGYPEGHQARRQAFERDKRLLREEGVKVLAIPTGDDDQLGYRVDPNSYYLPDLDLDEREQAALNVAVAGVHIAHPIGRDALQKLGVGVESVRRAGLVSMVDLVTGEGFDALPVLFEAVRTKAAVTFVHRGVERHVDPAALRFAKGQWYVVGYDRDREAGRTFRVDRIEGVPECGQANSGQLPEGFDVDATFRLDPWEFGDGDAVDVLIAVDAAESGRVIAELGTEVVESEGEDGSTRIRLRVTDVDALLSWVLDLLDHAEVLEPPEVRATMVERLQRMISVKGDLS